MLTPAITILASGVTLTGIAVFNRIAGDAHTDAEFGVGLKAYAQMPGSFYDETANLVVFVFSDADPATWQPGSATQRMALITRRRQIGRRPRGNGGGSNF
jgi:hypothetical protein